MWQKIKNLLKHGKWTDCKHKNVDINSKYFMECQDCGVWIGF